MKIARKILKIIGIILGVELVLGVILLFVIFSPSKDTDVAKGEIVTEQETTESIEVAKDRLIDAGIEYEQLEEKVEEVILESVKGVENKQEETVSKQETAPKQEVTSPPQLEEETSKASEPKTEPQPVVVLEKDSDPTPIPAPHSVKADGSVVYVTENGKKYHSTPTCSNMKNPFEMTLEQAIASGRGACSKCW